ncbi:MAG: Fe-Mn family superoxide dismutase, partial [Ardenticatenaceae bacterium]
MDEINVHTLAALPYSYHALEPALERRVVEGHHARHNAELVRARNEAERALARWPSRGAGPEAERLLALKRRYPALASATVLHEIYWGNMHPAGRRRPTGDLKVRLEHEFGSYEGWVDEFVATAMAPEAGWALLVHDPSDHRLRNVVVEGHDRGAVWGAWVLVACDVWEHAYYKQYGSQRGEYARAFLDLLEWETIADAYYRSPYGNARSAAEAAGEHRLAPLPFG